MRCRHIVQGTPPAGASSASVLGKTFYAQGMEGWTGGTVERKLGEEGTLSVTLPNDAGEDGKMHRDRFYILTKGRRSKVPEGARFSASETYRPGDEWIEVYEGDHDLIFVGTPINAKITGSTVELQLVDGFWLTRKTREREVGIWHSGPREVFSAYSSVHQIVQASDFEGVTLPYGTTPQSTTPFQHLRADTPVPGQVRLRPDPGLQAYIRGYNGLPFGTANPDPDSDLPWRIEWTFYRTALGGLSSFDEIEAGVCDSSVRPIVYVAIRETQVLCWVIHELDATWFGGLWDIIDLDTRPPGPVNVAIEVRDRWAYFFIDGQLRSVMHLAFTGQTDVITPATNLTVFPYLGIWQAASSATEPRVHIESLTCYRNRRILQRGSDRGEMRVPGAPPPDGLLGHYYRETQEGVDKELMMRALKPQKEAYANRIDPTVNFPAWPESQRPAQWMPVNTPDAKLWSTRLTGSIYLDLANFDYWLRLNFNGRVRMWVGDTRFTKPALARWVNAAFLWGMNTASLRTHLGTSQSGWYPIVIEYLCENENALLRLRYYRSDQPVGMYQVVGSWDYYHLSNAYGATSLVPFGEGTPDSDTAATDIGASADGTYVGAVAVNGGYHDANHVVQPRGPIPGEVGTDFDGGWAHFTGRNLALTSGSTNTVWFWLKWANEAAHEHAMSFGTATANLNTNVWFYREGANNFFGIGTGNGELIGISAAETEAMRNRWSFVVLQFVSGTPTVANTKIWVDGVAKTIAFRVGTASVARVLNGVLRVGAENTAAPNKYNGVLAAMGMKGGTLTTSQIAALWASGNIVTPQVKLSPYGVYNENVRFESHYDQVKAMEQTFGYQFTVEPKQLESGEFPGKMVPRLRVGRDTDKIVTDDETTDDALDISAEESVDAILADAAGLATETEAQQITAEVTNHRSAGKHLVHSVEHESLAEISQPSLLLQRLGSMLALRTQPWEEVAAQPRGHRELMDTFPLTGAAAEFAWAPGDGVRLRLERQNTYDHEPRQIMSVARRFTPDGVTAPSVGFAQRPRSVPEMLRGIQRTFIQQGRNYQGQLVVVMSSHGAQALTIAHDAFCRYSMPDDESAVLRAILVVLQKSDSTPWDVAVNSVGTGLVVTKPGRYNITPWVKRLTRVPQGYAALVSQGAGSTGSSLYVVELMLRV